MSDPGELESNSSSSPGAKQSISKRFSAHLHGEVDTKEIGWISVYACFLTGFTSSHSFSACFIWCGFQTGNVAQLGLALARTFNPEPYRTFGFQKADQQALCSLLTFLLGTSLGRLGDKIGPKKRIWLITTALVQSLLGMAAALAAHYSDQAGISTAREEPSWTNALGFTALGFLSATMGIQGIVGKRLASPLNTTIVLTTTWVELINDPSLFSLRFTHSRDIRIAGVAMILLGAFVARAILGSAGSAGSIGVMVAFRLIQMVWWGCIKGSAPKVKS